jgi:hypothetical protein
VESSVASNRQTQDFSRLTLDIDLEGMTADFTVREELLGRNAGVNQHLESLAAEWALNEFANLHRANDSKGLEGSHLTI